MTAFPPDRFGAMLARTSSVPESWTGRAHDTDAPLVFLPENMLREARRQRLLAPSLVPPVCVLNPDGGLGRVRDAASGSLADARLGPLPFRDAGL